MEGKEILPSLTHQPGRARVVVVRALRLGDLLCATPALRSLRAALPRAHITLIGLPMAREFVSRCRFLDDFEEFPGYPGVAVNCAGQTSLGTLAALIERLSLFISNDSGPAHIAAAVGTPSITIFGASNVEDWAASDTTLHRTLSVPVPCRPCYLSECPTGYLCLQGVTVEMVIDTAKALLTNELCRPDRGITPNAAPGV